MNRRSLLLSSAAFGLAGCSAPGTNFFDLTLPPAPDLSSLKTGMSIVVTRINLRLKGDAQVPELHMTIYNKPSTGFPVGMFTFKPGTNFYVVELTPGRYRWDNIFIGHLFSALKDDLIFTSVEKQVTYIGDIDIVLDGSSMKYGLNFSDRTKLAQAQFERVYPKMSIANRMVSAPTLDKNA